jgi:DnaJ-class molecular chaperone
VPPEFAKFSKTFRMNNNQGFGINQGQSFFGNSFGPAAGLSQQQFAGPSNDDLLEMLRRMQMGQGVGKDSFSTTTFPGRRQATKQTPPESFTRTVSCTLSELNKGATKKLSIKYGKESRVYTIQLQPHWKPGTKVTFKARDGFPEMIFVIQVKDAVFQRRGDNDVVYRYPKNLKNIVAEANLNGLVSLDVPLLDGTMSRKKIRKTALLAMSSGGKPLKLQGQGMIGKDKQTRGNMIVEFH